MQRDIITGLGIDGCSHHQLSFNRTNLDYEVRDTGCTPEALGDYITKNHARETGIVYCTSKERCEKVATVLRDRFGLPAMHYHAGMGHENRDKVQDEWYEGKLLVIVATVSISCQRS